MSTPPGAAPKAKGNVLTRKIGPLPTWAWTGIILTPILIYAVIERKKSSSTTAASATTGTTSASQVPQFVNQTYTSVQAPSAPNSTGTTPVTTGPATTTTATTPTPTVSTPAPTPAPSAPVAAAAGGVVIPSEIGERA